MTSPLRAHHLEQYLAFALEVQAALVSHKRNLLAVGWSEAEAWAWCQRVEERLLGPVLDLMEEESPL
jgi:hypothetical protein